MTATGTGAARSPLGEAGRLPPRQEQASAEPVEASPLWPLVRLLAEIATRVEREQAAARDTTAVPGATEEPRHNAA